MTTLRRVATTRGGAGFPHAEQGLDSGELPFIKVSDFNHQGNERTITRCSNWISRVTAARLGASVVPSGTLLLPKVGAALLGNARRLTSRPSVFDNNVLAVVPTGIESRYLHYWLSTVDAAAFAKPGPVPSMGDDALLDLVVPVEGTAEQWAIADYLDAETARIDALIAKKQQLIHLLEERRSSMLESRLHDELLNVTSVPVRHVATFSGGITLGGSHGPGERSLRPYLRVANVQDGYLDLDEISEIAVTPAQASRFALRFGDVLMLEGNGNPDNLGRGTIWRGEVPGCLHQNHIHVVRPVASRLLPEFFDLVARSPFARAQLTGGAGQVSIATLSKSDIADLRIPLPSVAEQRTIVDQVKRDLKLVERLRATAARQIDLLAEHRQALITAAVTGEFTVPGAA